MTFDLEIVGYRRSYRPRGQLRPRSGLRWSRSSASGQAGEDAGASAGGVRELGLTLRR